MTLSSKERRLLQRLQAGLPVVSRPFDHLSRECQMEELEVLTYLKTWKEQGLIRWVGVIFSTHALGYKSTLAAMSIPPDNLLEAAGLISQHSGVTHNYQRDYDYNLWFTLAVPPEENIQVHLEKLAQASGAKKWINLPVVKTYKIRLVLPLAGDEQGGGDEQGRGGTDSATGHIASPTERIYTVTGEEKALIRILQEDWPLVLRPYQVLASQWGRAGKNLAEEKLIEENLIEKISQWKERGIIRRIAAILRHHEAGFIVNWMVAWRVQEEKIDLAGERAAQNPLVSHCYHRRPMADWTYPLFTMVHARSEEEARKTVSELNQVIEPLDYKILPTVREFKKVRLKLFS